MIKQLFLLLPESFRLGPRRGLPPSETHFLLSRKQKMTSPNAKRPSSRRKKRRKEISICLCINFFYFDSRGWKLGWEWQIRDEEEWKKQPLGKSNKQNRFSLGSISRQEEKTRFVCLVWPLCTLKGILVRSLQEKGSKVSFFLRCESGWAPLMYFGNQWSSIDNIFLLPCLCYISLKFHPPKTITLF